MWSEIKQLWEAGLENYLYDMWNVVDFFTNMLYLACIGLRFSAWIIVRNILQSSHTKFKHRVTEVSYTISLIIVFKSLNFDCKVPVK